MLVTNVYSTDPAYLFDCKQTLPTRGILKTNVVHNCVFEISPKFKRIIS